MPHIFTTLYPAGFARRLISAIALSGLGNRWSFGGNEIGGEDQLSEANSVATTDLAAAIAKLLSSDGRGGIDKGGTAYLRRCQQTQTDVMIDTDVPPDDSEALPSKFHRSFANSSSRLISIGRRRGLGAAKC